jgi:3-methyladenine DNA glycosylase AlkD
MLNNLKRELEEVADSERAKTLQRFFKTGKGKYGEGDIFIGIKLPDQKNIVKKYKDLSLDEIQELLNSEIHEHRSIALSILNDKYKESDNKKELVDFYLANTKKINNWDLVDGSAPKIIGDFLLDKKRNILYKLAQSENLWEKRIAIVSTFTFIRNKEFEDTLAISKILLNDKHDLIHKAVGWMLREVGKRNVDVLKKFLKDNYKNLPRTTLRYAIEKFEEEERKRWLKGEI